MIDSDIHSGLIRLRILHDAAKHQISDRDMMEELARHGYSLSAGTVCRLLLGLESDGYLSSFGQRDGKHKRGRYRITPAGQRELITARKRIRALLGELCDD